MTSKTRIQNYLRENKISELFEEMMGKLIRDLPASPLYYLTNFLHEKEKKVKQIIRDTSSPKKEKKLLEISENARLWATTPSQIKKQPSSSDIVSPSGHDNRKYEKPWLSHSKKSPSKSKSASKVSHTAPISNSTDMERSDDVIEGNDEVDLCLIYATPRVFGDSQVKTRSAEEEMAAELSLTDVHDKMQDNIDSSTPHIDKNLSAKDAKRKRLEDLKRLADENKSRSPRTQSPIIIDDEDDDALEVLENANELMSEGVKNPPKTGVIVGRSADKGKEQIELILNMSKFFDELGGMDGVTQNQISESATHSHLDDDDFESASQVTGPRRPVWDAPDTEVESGASQVKGAQASRIGIDSFIEKNENGEESGEGSRAKSPIPSQKSPSPRPHTAPSKSNIDLNGSQGPESPKKTGKSPRSRPTTPRGSRPATPRGSQVGSGRASRRMSQASNLSAKQASETAKSVNENKAKE